MVLNSDLNSLINNPLFGSNSCSKNEDELENKNESEELSFTCNFNPVKYPISPDNKFDSVPAIPP